MPQMRLDFIAENFWDRLHRFGDRLALIDEHTNQTWSYRRLHEAMLSGRDIIRRPQKKLIFLFANNDSGAIACYLSALAAGHLVYLGKGSVEWHGAAELLDRYKPDFLLWKSAEENAPLGYSGQGKLFDYHVAERLDGARIEGMEIALLLSTSGSLGSPKMVRLSAKNISAAADQVARALRLDSSHRAITALPLNFVFGLSVIHGHLHAGASLVLTNRSVQDRAFWRLLDQTKATSLAGVPWTCTMLRSLSFDPARHNSLRHLSLSGGRLEPALLAWLKTLAKDGLDIFSMYGQTEATGRMCVLAPEHFVTKPESVGKPVEGGKIHCDDDGNIVFQGPNVMRGYAECRDDLTDFDALQGKLATGDFGYLDGDGFLYVAGRTARIAKLFGSRIDLAEIESFFNGTASVAATCDDHSLQIFVEGGRLPELDRKVADLVQRLHVPSHFVAVRIVGEFPRSETGKIRYAALQENRKSGRPTVG